MTANLILADDNSATRSALAFILSRRLGLGVAGEAASAGELVWLLRTGAPDANMVILDWDLPGLCAGEGVADLKAINPRVKIVVLSALADARQQALAAGADAFVSMVEPPEVLLSTIHTAAGKDTGM